MNELPRHTFWGAGEPDCPKELKAPNGELCTMRCKACGDGWRKSSDVCLAAHTLVPLEPASQEPQDYAPPLDDEGRLMTGTDHHYTAENVRSIIARLRRFASGSHESAEEFANLDWRGWSNVLWRVMSALAAEVPCPAQEPQGEAQPVARYTVEKQSGSEWARVVDRKTGEQVARYSVMPRKRSQRDGWKDAEQHAARLNAAIAAQPDPRGPQGEAQQPDSSAIRALKLGQPQQPQSGDLVVGVGDGSYDACASHGLAHPCEMCAYEKEVAPLESALAECRDLFPIPEPGQPAEEEWLEAMSCPASVPAFIRASLAAGRVEQPARSVTAQEDKLLRNAAKRSATLVGAGRLAQGDTRTCTCHPDDNPPTPCPRKFAYSDCVAAAQGDAPQDGGVVEGSPERAVKWTESVSESVSIPSTLSLKEADTSKRDSKESGNA